MFDIISAITIYKYNKLFVCVCVCVCMCRLSNETLRKLVECVYGAQEEELTRCFLQKVDGDLTSCSLNWEELHYFLRHSNARSTVQQITVDLRKSNIQCRISEILPFLNMIQFKR